MRHAGDSGRLNVMVARKGFANAAGRMEPILADISFALSPGEVAALVGPSGCGKTTLLRIIAGLDREFEGAVTSPTMHLGFVFQEPRLMPWRSVEDNVRIAAPEATPAELDALFEALELSRHRSHYPRELSLGLARRVAIARAFAVRPDLLLLDEPFVSLDEALADQLQAELVALVESRGVTTILVTHDLAEAVRLAERVIVLQGRPAHIIADLAIDAPRRQRSARFVDALTARIRAARGSTQGSTK
jgi:ABC-type nitrate/sulfonate/bicarbonate transport system ATPase subunit